MKKKLKIGLVEDNRFHAVLFEQSIRENFPDSSITIFKTGKSLLKAQKQTKFDLLAIDYDLPDMTGIELLTLERGRLPDLPIIIITGVGSEQIAVEAMKSGATDYIAKSGDYTGSLPRVVKQAYQKQRLIAKNRRLEQKAIESEKLETITATASTLNHEINNPLMTILGAVELALDNRVTLDGPTIIKMEMIRDSAKRIQSITGKISNLISPTTKETPGGRMLNLTSPKSGCSRLEQAIASTNKSV